MKLVKLFVLALVLVALSGLVSATPAIKEIKVNGDVVFDGTTYTEFSVEREDTLNVRVILEDTAGNATDIQIETMVRGYDHNDHIEDLSDVFNMQEDVSYVKKLSLKLPDRMDKGKYKFMVIVSDKMGQVQNINVPVTVETPRHAMQIKDVVFSPEFEVKAGRALLATARIKNFGDKDEEGIKVSVSMPELGISASDYIDELEAEDTTTSEELYLRIPKYVAEGTYKVIVKATFDDGDEVLTKEYAIKVVSEEAYEAARAGKTMITVGPESQALEAGKSAFYQLTVSNAGANSRTYAISAEVGDWAALAMSPSNVVVLNAGESETVYLTLKARDNAAPGEHMFAVSVKSGDQTLKQIALKANVAGSTKAPAGWAKVKRALEIGLVVLVVLLVILGLIIGFNKLKGEEDEADEEGQTYY